MNLFSDATRYATGLVEACHHTPHKGCLFTAVLAAQYLREHGVPAEPTIGFAAWKVSGEMIGYHEDLTPVGDFPAHAWVVVNDKLFDPSVGFLSDALKEIGGESDWSPDYLLLDKDKIATIDELRASASVGACHYEQRPEFNPYLEQVEQTILETL